MFVNRPASRGERALGSYLGLAIGDALGATVEFMTAHEISATYRVHKDIIGGGWLRLRAGQVTDDTQMCLALGGAILASEAWDTKAAAEAFVVWMRSKPVDIGNTCRRGIRRYLQDGSLQGMPASEDGGNGALMRNLPVVLFSLYDEAALFDRSLAQAHITHWHHLSDAAILAVARMTRVLLLGQGIEAARVIADELAYLYPEFRYAPWKGNTSGYVVDTVQTVFDAFFNTTSFEDCLIRVVNRGGDADTTGALAGQLAGALYGVQSIPVRWMKKLELPVHRAICEQSHALLVLGDRLQPQPPSLVPEGGPGHFVRP